MQSVRIIVLAAGRSQRFCGDKLLTVTNDGRTLIDRTLSKFMHSDLLLFAPIFVAVHESHEVLSAQVRAMEGCELVPITGDHRGLGVSIAQSLAHISQRLDGDLSQSVSGWMIALADMPSMRTSTIVEMLKEFDGHRVLQPQIMSAEGDLKSGHPVIFPISFTEQLLQLSEDKGGRDILRHHPEMIKPFITSDRGVLVDVDTRIDLSRLPV